MLFNKEIDTSINIITNMENNLYLLVFLKELPPQLLLMIQKKLNIIDKKEPKSFYFEDDFDFENISYRYNISSIPTYQVLEIKRVDKNNEMSLTIGAPSDISSMINGDKTLLGIYVKDNETIRYSLEKIDDNYYLFKNSSNIINSKSKLLKKYK